MSRLHDYFCPPCGHKDGKHNTTVSDVWADQPPPVCPRGHGPMVRLIGAAHTIRSFSEAPTLARILDQTSANRRGSPGSA